MNPVGNLLGLIGICFTAGAMMLCSALLFQGHASRAREACNAAPWRGLMLGMLIAFPLTILSLVAIQTQFPPLKLLGTMVLLALMALAALGGSGIALHLSDRIRALDPSLSRYAALVRSVALLTIACALPLLGWFLFMPVFIVSSVGFAVLSVAKRAELIERI